MTENEPNREQASIHRLIVRFITLNESYTLPTNETGAVRPLGCAFGMYVFTRP